MALAARSDEAEPILLTEIDGHILRLTMNRPAARNALSMPLMGAMI